MEFQEDGFRLMLQLQQERGWFLHLVGNRGWPAAGFILHRSSGAATGARSWRLRAKEGVVAGGNRSARKAAMLTCRAVTTGSSARPTAFAIASRSLPRQWKPIPTTRRRGPRLSEALLVSSVFGLLPPSDSGTRMKEAALRAISFNPSLPEAHVALGSVLSLLDWDWAAGEEELQKSIQLDKSDPIGHLAYGIHLACRGGAGFGGGGSGARPGSGSCLAISQLHSGLDVRRLPSLRRSHRPAHAGLAVGDRLRIAASWAWAWPTRAKGSSQMRSHTSPMRHR